MKNWKSVFAANLLFMSAISLSASSLVLADSAPKGGVRIDCELPNDRNGDGKVATLVVVHSGRSAKAGWTDSAKGPEFLGPARASRDGAYYNYGFQIVTKGVAHGCQIGPDTTTTLEKVLEAPIVALLYPPIWAVFGNLDNDVYFLKQVTQVRYNSLDPSHSEVLTQNGNAHETTRLTRTSYEMGKVVSHAAVCRMTSLVGQ